MPGTVLSVLSLSLMCRELGDIGTISYYLGFTKDETEAWWSRALPDKQWSWKSQGSLSPEPGFLPQHRACMGSWCANSVLKGSYGLNPLLE